MPLQLVLHLLGHVSFVSTRQGTWIQNAVRCHSSLYRAPLLLTHRRWTCAQVRVEIESLAEGVDLSEPLTRARFEELVGDLLKKTLGPVRKARTRYLRCPYTSC